MKLWWMKEQSTHMSTFEKLLLWLGNELSVTGRIKAKINNQYDRIAIG